MKTEIINITYKDAPEINNGKQVKQFPEFETDETSKFSELINTITPRLDVAFGKAIIFGTGGELSDGYNDIFYKPC